VALLKNNILDANTGKKVKLSGEKVYEERIIKDP
jgi:hypothetical protein